MGLEAMAIEQMYQIYEKLNSAEDKTKLVAEYRQFLEAAHRSDKEKRLASQFITRFVEFFPDMYDDAANAMLDLCEEEDPVIRKQVLKDLLTVCKKIKVCVPKIADVFCQLMLTADAVELVNLQNGLFSLFNVDAKGTLAGIFSQIAIGDESVRDSCFKFLSSRLKELKPDVSNFYFKKSLYCEIRNIIKWTSEEEFNICMDLIMHTKLMRQLGGNQLIVDLLLNAIDLEAHPNVAASSTLNSIFLATDYAIPLYCSQISPNSLIVYYFTKLIGQWQTLQARDADNTLQRGILRRIAELLLITTSMTDAEVEQCMPFALDLALDILPPIPEPTETEIVDNSMPEFNFTFCECALYFISRLGGFKPDLLPQSSRLEDLRKRMLLLHRGVGAFEKKLKAEFKGHVQNKQEQKKDLRDPENINKIISLKMMRNMNVFIRELYQKPPKYGGNIVLSWKPIKTGKRPAASTLPPLIPLKSLKLGREIQRYQPPSGKYSRGAYAGGSGAGGGTWSRGGGNFRGARRRF